MISGTYFSLGHANCKLLNDFQVRKWKKNVEIKPRHGRKATTESHLIYIWIYSKWEEKWKIQFYWFIELVTWNLYIRRLYVIFKEGISSLSLSEATCFLIAQSKSLKTGWIYLNPSSRLLVSYNERVREKSGKKKLERLHQFATHVTMSRTDRIERTAGNV